MLRRDLEARMARITGHPLGLRFEIGDVPEAPTS
jgi:hypothetical protein